MSKYTIKHICGHTSERQIIGPTCDRARKADYFAAQKCGKCWYADKQAAEKAKAVEINETAGEISLKFDQGVETMLSEIPAEKKAMALDIINQAKQVLADNGAAWLAEECLSRKATKPVEIVRVAWLYRK